MIFTGKKIYIILFIFLLILIILFILFFINNYKSINNYNVKYNYIIKIYNIDSSHLGDLVFNVYFLNKLKNYIENNNIIIEYRIDKKYHNEIKDLINSKNIKILDYEKIGFNLDFYFNNYIHSFFYYNIYYSILNRQKIPYDLMYLNLFRDYYRYNLNIPVQINNFYNEDETLLTDYDNLKDVYKNIDILIINSIPRSGQYNFNVKEWDDFVKYLNKKYKIVTTRKVENISCTWDDKLTIKKISAISTRSKVIIAINTGPAAAIFNKYTLNYSKKIYILDNRVQYKNIHQLENIDNLYEINIEKIDIIIYNFYKNSKFNLQ